MAAIASGLWRREVAVDVREVRAGEMPGLVLVFAPALRPGEVVTHVDDDVRGVGEVRGEVRGRDERGEHRGPQSLRTCGAGSARVCGCNRTAMMPAATISAMPSHAIHGNASAKSAMPSTDENTMPL